MSLNRTFVRSDELNFKGIHFDSYDRNSELVPFVEYELTFKLVHELNSKLVPLNKYELNFILIDLKG